MRVFDPDGTEAEACGNGLRCLAKYVLEKGLISAGTDPLFIETVAGVRKVKFHQQGGKLLTIQATMGKPEFQADAIPVVINQGEGDVVDIKSMLSYPVTVDGTDLILNLVSMGNPHAVCFWQRPVSDFPLSQLGPKVEHHKIFPEPGKF